MRDGKEQRLHNVKKRRGPIPTYPGEVEWKTRAVPGGNVGADETKERKPRSRGTFL